MRQLISKILSDKRVQISIAIALVIAIGLLFYDSPPEDNSVSFSQYREVLEDAKIRPQTTAIPSLSPKEENVSPETRNVEFEEALASARQAHKRCELAFRKLLPNKKWPAPFGPSYEQVQDLTGFLNAGLTPSLAKEDDRVLKAIESELMNGHGEMNPARVQTLLRTFWELESCRGRDWATLFDAVLELARKNKAGKKYQDADARALVGQIWRALVQAQKGSYTPADLVFLLGFWQKAMAQGLIAGEYRGELTTLSDKILHEMHEDEARLPQSGIALSREKFLDFFHEIQALGHELEDFGKEVLLDR